MMVWLNSRWQKGLVLFLLLVAFILTHRFFFLTGDFPTHDGVHFIRLYNLERILGEGQFPPRWLPDLGKGYGYPFFNFYPPLSYFAGMIFRFLGTSFTLANKLSFALAGLVGTISIFFLGKLLFGFWGGAISALFWLFLPYRALSIYVRGTLAEYWGMNLLPLAFYFAKSFFDQQNIKKFLCLTFSLFLILIAHNAVALIGLAWLVVFVLFLFVANRDWSWTKLKQWAFFDFSFVLALGMAAFFILPAILEKNLTHIADMTSGYYAYYNHFPSLRQLFLSRYWNYGGSVFGIEDGMSFQIGHFHWLAVFLTLALLGWRWFSDRKFFYQDKKTCLPLFFLVFFWFFAFLSHQRSIFIWQGLPFLAFLQFPWRFLIFIGLSASVLAGFLVNWLRKGFFLVFVFLFLALLGLNFNYFQPRERLDINDQSYLSYPLWQYQQREFLTDYLPKTVKEVPEDHYQPPLIVAQEKVEISLNRADKIIFAALLPKEEEVIIKRFYFPGWQARVNKELVDIRTNENGFMVLSLPEGKVVVEISLQDTSVRRVANWISLFSWGAFLFFTLTGQFLPKNFFKKND